MGLARVLRRGAPDGRLRLPRHRAAVRPLRALRRARAAARPAADRLLAVPGHRGRADLRAGQRRGVLELLRLLRHAVLRDRLRLDDPLALREGDRRAAARGRLPPPRGARRLGQPHRGGPPRARRRGPRARRHARVHLAHPAARQRPALARAGSRTCRRCSSTTACRRSSSPTRTSRRSGRSSWWTSATGAGSPCGSRRRRWRSCCTGRSSCPARRCRCSSCARRCSTASTTSSSAASTSSARCSCCSC